MNKEKQIQFLKELSALLQKYGVYLWVDTNVTAGTIYTSFGTSYDKEHPIEEMKGKTILGENTLNAYIHWLSITKNKQGGNK